MREMDSSPSYVEEWCVTVEGECATSDGTACANKVCGTAGTPVNEEGTGATVEEALAEARSKA